MGEKLAMKLYLWSRGIDYKPLNYFNQRKSISVELSYAIRFSTEEQVGTFLNKLSALLHQRLEDSKMKGKTLTLVIYKASPLQKPTEYLGKCLSSEIEWD